MLFKERGGSAKTNDISPTVIEYETSQDDSLVITKQDVLEVEEFAKQPNMISKLVDMFAPTVIGHEDKKLGIILMYMVLLRLKILRSN